MTDITIHTEPAFLLETTVEGTDLDVARSAWASTKGEKAADEADPVRVAGLINFLMRERHGSPFEQVGFRFLVKTPIVVWREHMRHRIASYNEQSGRYMQLAPEFYSPGPARPLTQGGKPGAYTFSAGTLEQQREVRLMHEVTYRAAYGEYEYLLGIGVAKEVARMHLPPTIYSTAFVRINLRSLMNFLSLRSAPTAMYEIRYLAGLYEAEFQTAFPLVHRAWQDNGRQAP